MSQSSSRLGIAIKTRRRERFLTLGDLAEKVGVSVTYLSEVESGGRKPFPVKGTIYQKLAEALDLPEEDLVNIALMERQEVPNEVTQSEELREFALKLFRKAKHLDPSQIKQLDSQLDTFLKDTDAPSA